MSKIMGRMYTPPPRWFIVTRKLIGLATNFTITALMITGRRADDQMLLIIKLGQSFLMDVLDSLIADGGTVAFADGTDEQADKKNNLLP